jgi:hypothetical protein
MEQKDSVHSCFRRYSLDELQAKIDEYFEMCKPKYVYDEKGQLIPLGKDQYMFTMNTPSINGLCRYLGYRVVGNYSYIRDLLSASRAGRKTDKRRIEIFQMAIQRIAEWHESRLVDRNNNGSIFWLKHAQSEIWGEDKVQITGNLATVNASVSLTPEEEVRFKEHISAIFTKPEGEIEGNDVDAVGGDDIQGSED